MTTMARDAARTDQLLELYWQEIKDNEPLGRQEEVELFGRAHRGDDAALQRIAEANLRFVMRVANEYVHPDGPPLIELVAEGNVGLMAAIERFDETRGFKFITYAVWWIRQAIHRSLSRQRRSARQPTNRLDDFAQIERRAEALSQKLGRVPSFDEVIDEADMTSERALAAMEAHQQDLSFDQPLQSDGDMTLHGVYGGNADVDEGFDQDALTQRMHECLELLDSREALILRAYYGVGGLEPRTLEQIGEDLKVTRERVRQLRNRALKKLRAEHAEELLDWSMN